MNRKTLYVAIIFIPLLVAMLWLFVPPSIPAVSIPATPEAIERGRYLLHAGGCVSCHKSIENAGVLSGGLALESEFGTFYVPNITPDPTTGIGGWEGRDFLLAMQHGRRPGGGFYYPAFPYRAYAGMRDNDILDIAAYLMAQMPVSSTVSAHQLSYPIQRWMIAFWNRLADMLQPALPDESDPQIARGAYLARQLGHCGECHTPRNSLGIPDLSREFAGVALGDRNVPAINAEALAHWSEQDFILLLFLGLTPDDDYVGGEMGDVIEDNTSRLSEEDRQAMAAFFKRG